MAQDNTHTDSGVLVSRKPTASHERKCLTSLTMLGVLQHTKIHGTK